MNVCNYISCEKPACCEDEQGDPVCTEHKVWRSCAICGETAVLRDAEGWDYCPLHAGRF